MRPPTEAASIIRTEHSGLPISAGPSNCPMRASIRRCAPSTKLGVFGRLQRAESHRRVNAPLVARFQCNALKMHVGVLTVWIVGRCEKCPFGAGFYAASVNGGHGFHCHTVDNTLASPRAASRFWSAPRV
jgi:hypothetical protein